MLQYQQYFLRSVLMYTFKTNYSKNYVIFNFSFYSKFILFLIKLKDRPLLFCTTFSNNLQYNSGPSQLDHHYNNFVIFD